MRNIVYNIGAAPALAPAVLTATATGAVLDLLGFESAAIIIATGAIVGDGNYTAKLQESDTTTAGDFTDVDDDQLQGTFPASLAADSVVKVGYAGFKRYLRLVVTKNSGTSIVAVALLIKGHAHQRPVS
ncbi:hypothetical protein [Pleomorphomonas carboxyditropha]|uniref:Uncharacterized protein n=1 Tax=Pleomorphomonas carboxyditropha TaxID=2023338 RepID=A0A2G9WY75_9HYPH|nr:hypothetical protein [Pleomorphomonas carboxyditropha]PIO99661.1 hypothetical protein CJ014_10175 [Pleomorphomonas carboxyditropha]